MLLTILISPFADAGSESRTNLLTDSFGHTLELSTPTPKVISLAPSITEALFALQAGEQLLAATKYCDYPEAAKQLPRVGGIIDFDLEKIVALKPDVVFAVAAAGNSRKRIIDLQQLLGNRVYVFKIDNLDDIYDMLSVLGQIMQRKSQAAELRNTMLKTIAQVHLKSRKLVPKRVILLIGCRPDMAAGGGTYLDEWLQIAGADNIMQSQIGYPILNYERLMKNPPRLLLQAVSSGNSGCAPLHEYLKQLPEVQVRQLPDDLFQRPGPRAAEAIEYLFNLIHDSGPNTKKRLRRG